MDRIRQRDVTTRKTFQGAWEVSVVHDDRRKHMQYFGYTKRQAIREFVRAVNNKEV